MSSATPLSLDPNTLLFAISVLGFATAAFAFSSSRAVGSERSGLVQWGQAMSAVGAAFLLFFLRGHAPEFFTYVVANITVLAVPAFGLLAHMRFFSIDPPRRRLWALVVFGIAGPVAVHGLGMPLGVGVFTMSIAMATLLAMTASLIIRKKGLHLWAPSSFAAVTTVLLSAVLVVRAIVSAAGSGASVSLASDSGHMAWPLVVGLLFVVGATIGFVMMVHDRQRKVDLRSSRRDLLTGLHTRAAFIEAASAVHAQAHEPYSLVVVDIDRFKAINDSHGHTSGDLVLAQAGRLILGSIRRLDVAGRFGGDEFCIVLRSCGQVEAKRFADRLILDASRQQVRLPSGVCVGFTLSAGYATRPAASGGAATIESTEQLFERADAALYEAKRGGRTRAVAATEARLTGVLPGSSNQQTSCGAECRESSVQ